MEYRLRTGPGSDSDQDDDNESQSGRSEWEYPTVRSTIKVTKKAFDTMKATQAPGIPHVAAAANKTTQITTNGVSIVSVNGGGNHSSSTVTSEEDFPLPPSTPSSHNPHSHIRQSCNDADDENQIENRQHGYISSTYHKNLDPDEEPQTLRYYPKGYPQQETPQVFHNESQRFVVVSPSAHDDNTLINTNDNHHHHHKSLNLHNPVPPISSSVVRFLCSFPYPGY